MPAANPPQIVVLDCETTGLDAATERVIEIGVVRLDASLQPAATFSTLVDPLRQPPPQVTRLTGITAADLAAAPPFADAWPAVRDFIGDAVIVGHNIGFDLAFLTAETARAGLPVPSGPSFDTLEAALLLLPELDRHGLDALASELGLPLPTHRALSDAHATAALLVHLADCAAALDERQRALLSAARWQPLQLLDGCRSGIATAPASQTAGAAPTPAPEPPALPVDGDDWRHSFAEDGGLAAGLPGFRPRPAQLELADAVAQRLRDGGVGLFEAGTGMGKSLAYLVPAAFWSAAHGRRVIVSTKTKALQRQLAGHELPLVRGLLPPQWRWTLLMGRENYVCRRRLDEAMAEAASTLAEPERSLALVYLQRRCARGEVDLSNLPFRAQRALPALAEAARDVRSSSAACLRRGCPARAACFWRLARERAAAAHLVCVNHALLLSGPGAVPVHEDVIVDEAHLLPDEAQSAFSRQIDRHLVGDLLREVRGRARQRPLAGRLRTAARGLPADESVVVKRATEEIDSAAERLDLVEQALAVTLGDLIAARSPASGPGAGYARSLWLQPGLREEGAWGPFAAACSDLGATLTTLGTAAAGVAECLPDDDREAAAARAVADRALPAADLLDELTEPGRAETVYWAEIEPPRGPAADPGRGTGVWRLTAAPLSPAGAMHELLWERLRSAVLLSATLSAGGSFSYYRRQTGLSADVEVHERVLPSPFDYSRQAVLILEHDPACPYDGEEAPARQAERLRRLVDVTGGRLLALFTNRRHMEQVAGAVGGCAQEGGVMLLAQGVHGSAAALADELRDHPATVLLGVDALWTGQDFPGDTLVCLVIAKLPFPRQDPLFQARRRAAEESGEDWFSGFYLPETILRFRQGFGRLIRTETDRGVIVVLDHRLTQKRYGDQILRSLPAMEIVPAAPDEVAAMAAHHLRRLGALPPEHD